MSDTSTPLPAAGWYTDPQNNTQLRFWDGMQWTDQVRPMITEQSPAEMVAQPAAYSGPSILVVTTNEIPGYRITSVVGEVCGLAVRTRDAFSHAGAGFATGWGGEATGYPKLLLDSRQEAVERLKAETATAGANAVVGMRYDSGEIADLMHEVAAYGTAVTAEPT
jgi:uncharacterized protein YbjQ (UPF0145 family)